MYKSLRYTTAGILAGLVCLCLSSFALAADKVVVIPMGGGKLQNIVTVATGGGNFTDPVAAVNSITDASATKPYLVFIAPGVYTLTSPLIMKPYVDINGSGANVTTLTGAISSAAADGTAAIIQGANNATLSNLGITNTGGNDHSIGVFTTGLNFSAHLQQLNIAVSGGKYNRGIFNGDHSSPQINDVTISVIVTTSATAAYGIFNSDYSSPQINGVKITTLAPTAYGIFNNQHSAPQITGSTISAYSDHAVYSLNNSSPKIRHSRMNGATVYSSATSTTILSQSTIEAGVGGTTLSCTACDDGDGHALSTSCVVIP